MEQIHIYLLLALNSINLKANDAKQNAIPLYLGDASKDFFVDNM